MRQPLITVAFIVLCSFSSYAQQYTGVTGLIHAPSAEMNKEGNIRIGAHYMDKHFTPDAFNFNGKYNTADYYLSVTPFSWVELAYTCTLQKNYRRDGHSNIISNETRYYYQDRYFSIKIRPLQEGKWWPAIAIGANDPFGTLGNKGTENDNEAPKNGDGKSEYFCNYYIAASKHLTLKNHVFGIHAAYRHWKRDYNKKWNGLVGGITYRPSFARNLRAIAEYTGNEVNVGADCLLWRHLLLQAVLQDGRYFSGGICFQTNLF